jgi:hypothetical protein
MSLTKVQMKKIVLSFPGTHEQPSYGKPAFFVEKKFFTRYRDEDDSMVLFVDSIDERDMLLEADAKLFHITDHYRDYPTVLARLAKLDAKTLHGFLERRWQRTASKTLKKSVEAKSTAIATPKKPTKKRAKK